MPCSCAKIQPKKSSNLRDPHIGGHDPERGQLTARRSTCRRFHRFDETDFNIKNINTLHTEISSRMTSPLHSCHGGPDADNGAGIDDGASIPVAIRCKRLDDRVGLHKYIT